MEPGEPTGPGAGPGSSSLGSGRDGSMRPGAGMRGVLGACAVCLAAAGWLGVGHMGGHPAGAQSAPAAPPEPAALPAVATPAAPSGAGVPPGRPTERGEVREAVAQRIDALHRRLRITPEEQPLWDAFAATMLRDALDSEARFRAGQAAGGLGAADGMEARARTVDAHAAMLHHLSDSFRPLYEAMSPEQRLAADQVFRQAQRQELRRGRETTRGLRE